MENQKISPLVLLELMEHERYGVEYQPIIDINSQEIFAYEALSRFFTNSHQAISPAIVYSFLHNSPLSLFQVEYQQKKLQLANAPNNGTQLFVNLDQDAFFASGVAGNDNPLIELFKSYHQVDATVELIENSNINDAVKSLSMIKEFSIHGINTAIDDVCNPQSMISTSVMQLVNFIKLDKHVVRNKNNKEFLCLVQAIIDYAHLSGKQVILEGIENNDDLQFAKKLKVRYVQGFLFKEKFIQIEPIPLLY